MSTITTEHVGRVAKLTRATQNYRGTTTIPTGATVTILRVDSPLSHLDGPDKNRVWVRNESNGVEGLAYADGLDLLDAHPAEPVPVADRERLARILDPDIFDETIKRSTRQVAQIQIAARQHMAYEGADRLLAAGGAVRSEAVALDREAVERAARAKIAEWYGTEWNASNDTFYETEDGGVTASEDTEAMLELRGVRLALDEAAKLARPEAVVKAEAAEQIAAAIEAFPGDRVSPRIAARVAREIGGCERADDLEGKSMSDKVEGAPRQNEVPDRLHEPIGGPSWPEERARYGKYAPGATEPLSGPEIPDEVVAAADRAYWDKFGTHGVAELQDGDAESIVSMRAALEAAYPLLLPTREEIAAVLRGFSGSGGDYVVVEGYEDEMAAAVLALLTTKGEGS